MTQEEGIILERHEGRLLLLEREVEELRSVQKEIRAMNESLVVLTNELRHTNEHMKSHGKRLGELERAPGARLREVTSAAVAALAAAIVSLLFQM